MQKFIVRLVDLEGNPITALKVPPTTTLQQLVRFVVGKRPDFDGADLLFLVDGHEYDLALAISAVAEAAGVDLAAGLSLSVGPRPEEEEAAPEPDSFDDDSLLDESEEFDDSSDELSPAADERKREVEVGGQDKVSESGEFWRQEMRKTLTRALSDRDAGEASAEPEQEEEESTSRMDRPPAIPADHPGADLETARPVDREDDDSGSAGDDDLRQIDDLEDLDDLADLSDIVVDSSPDLPASAGAARPGGFEDVDDLDAPSTEGEGEGDSQWSDEDEKLFASAEKDLARELSDKMPAIDDTLSELGDLDDFGDEPGHGARGGPSTGVDAAIGELESALDEVEPPKKKMKEAEPDGMWVGRMRDPDRESQAEAPTAITPPPPPPRAAPPAPAPAQAPSPVLTGGGGGAPGGFLAAAESATFSRKATVRHFKQMNPLRVFPLAVFFSERRIRPIASPGVAQTEGKKDLQISKSNPYVEIVPHFPGCLVTPERARINVKGKITQAVFAVTPLAEGEFDTARVEIYHGGEKVEEISTPTRVVKQTAARIAVAAGFVGPFLSASFDLLQLEREGSRQNPVTAALRWAVEQCGGWTGLGLAFGATCLLSAGVFYLMRRPRQGDPVSSMLEVDEWVGG